MPAKNAKDQDLFQESTMSFSQHLDELRICLIRAVTFLAIGVVIGFTYFGFKGVDVITMPLQRSLEHYVSQQNKIRLRAEIEKLRESGIGGNTEKVLSYADDYSIQTVYILPSEMKNLLHHVSTDEPFVKDADGRISPYEVDNFNKEKGTDNKKNLLPLHLLTKVKEDRSTKIKSLSSQEAFSIWIKVSFVGGLLISSPFVFWSIWAFIGAGLYPHERRYVYIFLPISVFLFLAGVLLAFFVVFQFVLDFLFFFNRMLNIEPDPRISEWLNFALMLPIGFGISFQLPLVMFFLERIGIFSIQIYLSKWRISSFAIVIISAMLTPGDPYSMLLMSIPLVVLYFFGILMCKIFPRGKSIFDFDDQDIVPVG